MKKKKGFTLIELLVVISIIGILAAILFVAINPKEQSDKAKDVRIKAGLSQIRTQAFINYGTGQNGGFIHVCDGGTNSFKIFSNLTKISPNPSGNPEGPNRGVNICIRNVDYYIMPVYLHNPSPGKVAFCIDSNGFVGEITQQEYNNIRRHHRCK